MEISQEAWDTRRKIMNKIRKITIINTKSNRILSWQRHNTCRLHDRTSTSIANKSQRVENPKKRNKMPRLKQHATTKNEHQNQREFKGSNKKRTSQHASPQKGPRILPRYLNNCQESEKKVLTTKQLGASKKTN